MNKLSEDFSKDSGIQWVGTIPRSWEVKKIKHLFKIVNGSTPKSNDPTNWDGDITWITPDDLGNLKDKVIINSSRKITKKGFRSSNLTLVPESTIILSTRAPIGHLGIAGVKVCTNQGCKSLVAKNSSTDYFYYHLLAANQELKSYGQGATFTELSGSKLAQIQICKPSENDQKKISSFLNKETLKIDQIISKYEDFIALLNEKRTALTNYVVTKGLNPQVEMKESNIEWMGPVPNHWKIFKSKQLFWEINERSAGDETDELLTVSHITGVTPRSEKPNVYMFMAESTEGYKRCEANDLVINTMWAWMGALGFAKQQGVVSPSYHVYRLKKPILSSDYYDKVFRTPKFASEIKRWSKGIWTSRLRLYPKEFYRIQIPVPPMDEQIKIANFIHQETGKTNNLVDQVNKAIHLLKERRNALIKQAVTGKMVFMNE